MDPLHARYPFLAESRAAVEAADIDLLDVVADEDSPIVERARERVEGAIHDGRVPDPIPDHTVELLSYPVARVLVSLVDSQALTERYALAEARRAFSLFSADRDDAKGFRSSRSQPLTMEDLLEDFGLADAVTVTEDGANVGVAAYLGLASDLRESDWRLVNRALADGQVPVARVELDALLQEAIRDRVGEDLPLDVPEVIAESLESDVATIESTLADVRLPGDLDRVVPAAFPPCLAAVIDRLRAGEELTAIERFTALSFLTAIGMDGDDLVRFVDPPDLDAAEQLRREATNLHGQTGSTAYPPPSCSTLEAAGVCVDDPDRCIEVGHPLTAYASRLDAYSDVPDWRASESA